MAEKYVKMVQDMYEGISSRPGEVEIGIEEKKNLSQ